MSITSFKQTKSSYRSNVEVRSPINSNSVGGWNNYKEMLKPAMKLLLKK